MTEQIRSVQSSPAEREAFDRAADDAIGRLGAEAGRQTSWVEVVRKNIADAGLSGTWDVSASGQVRRLDGGHDIESHAERQTLPTHVPTVELDNGGNN